MWFGQLLQGCFGVGDGRAGGAHGVEGAAVVAGADVHGATAVGDHGRTDFYS